MKGRREDMGVRFVNRPEHFLECFQSGNICITYELHDADHQTLGQNPVPSAHECNVSGMARTSPASLVCGTDFSLSPFVISQVRQY